MRPAEPAAASPAGQQRAVVLARGSLCKAYLVHSAGKLKPRVTTYETMTLTKPDAKFQCYIVRGIKFCYVETVLHKTFYSSKLLFIEIS